MAKLAIIYSAASIDSGVLGSASPSFSAGGFKHYSCYVTQASGTITGLVLAFETSPDGGANWFKVLEGKHPAVGAGIARYYFNFNTVITDQIRVVVDTVSTVASTVDIEIMGDK